MPIGNLTAFISYVMQILFSVMMATMLAGLRPQGGGVGRPYPGGARRRALHRRSLDAPRDPASATAARGASSSSRTWSSAIPGAEEAILSNISFTARTRADHRHRRQHRERQVHAHQPHPAPVRRHLRLHHSSTGVDIREMDRADLWRHIGFVPQKAFLFSGTVASNLRYGDETATDEDLWHALSIAQGKDFVEAMPEGSGTSPSRRAAPTSPAANGSGWPSPAPW